MFSKEDDERALYLQDDALVVTMQIANFVMWRILIDNDSSTDILFWVMRISLDHQCPASMPLKGFFGDVIQPIGAITMSVYVGKAPRTSATMTEFLVSSYNAILGRPMLNNFKAIMSTYHLKMKFTTNTRVGEVKGEQVLARECYVQEPKCGGKDVRTQKMTAGAPPPPCLVDQDNKV
ncbi:uncharacterized protein LOC109011717 [Juglans regia]|uniref:Uncharacterized protein LOC109011717 n=1 Tax=Juglans regia TaxID=51240 RepID=A0A2I4GXE3_JUGRE|nr:uncharacterized protein LOC109011717 [Juglans regia]